MYMQNKDAFEKPFTKQKRWRKKQLQIFYGNGRPLFEINEYNMFLKRFNDPKMLVYMKSHEPSLDLKYQQFTKDFYKGF